MTQHEKRWSATAFIIFVLALGIYLAFCETGYAVEDTHTVYPFQSTPDLVGDKVAGAVTSSFVTTNPVVPGSASATDGARIIYHNGEYVVWNTFSWLPEMQTDWLDGPGYVRSTDTSINSVIYFIEIVRKIHIDNPCYYGLIADTGRLKLGGTSVWQMNASGGSTNAYRRNSPTIAYYFRKGSQQVQGVDYDAASVAPRDTTDFDNIVIYAAKYDRREDGTGWDGEYALGTDWRSVGSHAIRVDGSLPSILASEIAPVAVMDGMAQTYPYYQSSGDDVNPADSVIGGIMSDNGYGATKYKMSSLFITVGGSFVSTAYAEEVFNGLPIDDLAVLPPAEVKDERPADPMGDLEGKGLGDLTSDSGRITDSVMRWFSWLNPWEWFVGDGYLD